MNTNFNYQDVKAKRDEFKSLKVTGAIFGTIHTGLIMAAELVNCAEAKLTEKITKGEISYSEQKAYRDVTSMARVIQAKEKLKSSQEQAMAKIREANEKAKAKVVQLKTA